MLNCKDRGIWQGKPYCKRTYGYCNTQRYMWCKGILTMIFTTLAIAYFAYGTVAALRNTKDRVDLLKKVEANRIEAENRMDDLELKLKEYNKTMVGHWLWQMKEWEKINGQAPEEEAP